MAETSFLPEDYVERKTQRRTNIISMTLFVVVMTGIIGAFLVTDRQRVEVVRKQREVNAQFEEAAKRLEQLDHMRVQKEEMLQKAEVTAVLIERLPRSLLLAELINTMPATLSLLEFELETKVVRQPQPKTALDAAKAKRVANRKQKPKPPPKINEATLLLVGVAPTDVEVAQYMTSLSKSEMFKDVNLVFSEETKIVDEQMMRKFKIEMKLNQNIDIRDVEPKLVKRSLAPNPANNSMQIDASGQLVVPTDQAWQPNTIPAIDSPAGATLKE